MPHEKLRLQFPSDEVKLDLVIDFRRRSLRCHWSVTQHRHRTVGHLQVFETSPTSLCLVSLWFWFPKHTFFFCLLFSLNVWWEQMAPHSDQPNHTVTPCIFV